MAHTGVAGPKMPARALRSSGGRADLVQALERAQAEGQALRPAAYPEEARDGPVVALLLDAQVGERVLACG
jgi:hypothetical protein